jgi:hypothetical protein
LKNVKWITELKARASFGYTGNPDVAANAYIQSINQSFQYTFGNSNGSGGIVPGAAPSRTFNPNIRWEKNERTADLTNRNPAQTRCLMRGTIHFF